MIEKIGKNCTGCEACTNVCPANAIKMVCDEQGFYYPKVSAEQCTQCGQCEKKCPICNASFQQESVKRAFAGYNKNYGIRSESTSGGIFSIIAQYVIEELSGVVVGVSFTEDFLSAEFILVDRVEGLKKIRKSKYLQARAGNIYEKIKQLLNSGVYVLFSGLPCHIDALNKFLDKNYVNLINMDMVCFGVPSPILWEKYLKELGINEIIDITFKDKVKGWKNWHFKLDSSNDEIVQSKQENPYMYSFLERLNVRLCCYECQFKGIERKSDITIADCWGKGEENKELNDDFGLSAILLQSEKAIDIWNNIKNQIEYEEYLPLELMEGNWAMFQCIKKNEYREIFFDDIKKLSFQQAIEKYRKVQKEKNTNGLF